MISYHTFQHRQYHNIYFNRDSTIQYFPTQTVLLNTFQPRLDYPVISNMENTTPYFSTQTVPHNTFQNRQYYPILLNPDSCSQYHQVESGFHIPGPYNPLSVVSHSIAQYCIAHYR